MMKHRLEGGLGASGQTGGQLECSGVTVSKKGSDNVTTIAFPAFNHCQNYNEPQVPWSVKPPSVVRRPSRPYSELGLAFLDAAI